MDTHSFIRYILHFSLWIWREFNSNEVYEFILFLPSLALILCIIRLLSDEKTFFFFFFGGAGTHPAGTTTTTTSTDLELKASISFPSTHNYFAYFYTYICFVLGLLDRWHFKNGFLCTYLCHFYPTFTENILDYLVLYFLSWNPQKSNSSKIGQSVRIKGLPPAPKLELGLSIWCYKHSEVIKIILVSLGKKI